MSTGYAVQGWAGTTDDADERMDLEQIEATLAWGDQILATKHVPADAVITLGESPSCDFFAPSEALGTSQVRVAAQGAVFPFEGSTLEGNQVIARGVPSVLRFADMTLTLRLVAAGKRPVSDAWERVREGALGSIGGSALLHVSVLAALMGFMPGLGADDVEQIDRDQIVSMQVMLDNIAEREKEREQSNSSAGAPGEDSASGGARAEGAEGAMGHQAAPPKAQGRWSVAGQGPEVTFAREHEKAMATNFGMIGLLASSNLADPNAPASPWGSVANGLDQESHFGNLWGDQIGDAFGGGLGLSGVGEGGGGTAHGVGLLNIGGLGHLDTLAGNGTCRGPGPCAGSGHGSGRVQGAHDPRHVPTMRHLQTEVAGRLPAEVIQRVVRQNQGRFRNCYAPALVQNPALTGRVAVKFVIDRQGGVSMAQDGGSDLPDQAVSKCVVQTFYGLSFPAPETGTVRVTYPIYFSPE